MALLLRLAALATVFRGAKAAPSLDTFWSDGTLVVVGGGPKLRLPGGDPLAFGQRGGRQILASSAPNRGVQLWDAETGQPLRCLPGLAAQVSCVAFSPDGRLVAAGSDDTAYPSTAGEEDEGDGTVPAASSSSPPASPPRLLVWDTVSGRCLHALKHEGTVLSLAFSPDGKRLAFGAEEGFWVWDLRTGKEAWRYTAEGKPSIYSLAYSPDGHLLAAACGGDDVVRLFDASTGKWLRDDPRTTGDDSFWSLSFSRDGKLLAAGDNRDTVHVWEVATGRELELLRGPDRWGSLDDVAFHPNRRWVAARYAGFIRLWDWKRNAPAFDLQLSPGSLAVSPDGRFLAGVSSDPKTGRLETAVCELAVRKESGDRPLVWVPRVTNPGDQVNTVGDKISLRISASDPHNDSLTFYAVTFPGLHINSETGELTGTIAEEEAQDYNGVYEVKVIVVNNHGGSASTSFTWTLRAAPPACPTASAGDGNKVPPEAVPRSSPSSELRSAVPGNPVSPIEKKDPK